jgi:hypothetical protein
VHGSAADLSRFAIAHPVKSYSETHTLKQKRLLEDLPEAFFVRVTSLVGAPALTHRVRRLTYNSSLQTHEAT